MKIEVKDLKKRVETGRLQINDDYAGLFIRGDECMGFVMYAAPLLEYLEKKKDLNIMVSVAVNMLKSYCKTIITKITPMSKPTPLSQAKELVKENKEQYKILTIAKCLNRYENVLTYLEKHHPEKVEDLKKSLTYAEQSETIESFLALETACDEILRKLQVGVMEGTPWIL